MAPFPMTERIRGQDSPNVTMRARQQLLRALITDIIADVDEAVREVILTIHWRGGQHSQLRVRKPKKSLCTSSLSI